MRKPHKPIPTLTERQLDNFWAKVNKSGDCWNWTATVGPKGYGQFGVYFNKTPRYFYAHRLSYFLAFNIDPSEKFVCHKCDNPKCVKPNHLFLGTNTDNMRDASVKGRTRSGSNVHNAKLDENIISEIRIRCENGETFTDLAKEFGISRKGLSNAAKSKTWKRLSYKAEIARYKPLGSKNAKAKLSNDAVIKMRKMRNLGASYADIAKKFGVHLSNAYRACSGKTWTHI